MRKTKIICTNGPASEKKEVLRELIDCGLNVARLNFSHGNHEEHKARMDMIKELREETGKHVAILLDTKGPEIRTRKFDKPEVLLEEGKEFTITTRDLVGNETIGSVTYEGIANDVVPGDTILIDDGLIGLEVLSIEDTEVRCLIKNTGVVKNNKGVNVPGVKINLPAITEKDRKDIIFGIEQGIDFIAASFVRKAEDVLAIREILEAHGGEDIHIISKIENQEGVDNINKIIEVSDGIMVARGDLGVEIPTEEIPLEQKRIIKACNVVGKPVVTATQMLDSMMRNPRPTRAEVTDVANAIFDGTDAIMLSGETAAGKYPAVAVQTMARIAESAENSLDYEAILREKTVGKEKSTTDAVSHASCNTAQDLGAKAIITATSSGYTARMVAKFRPEAPIVVTTTSDRVARKMAVTRGAYAVIASHGNSTDEVFDLSVKKAVETGFVNSGDLVVITAGVPVGVAGSTNTIKVHVVGDVVVKGTGLGQKSAKGKVCIANNLKEAEDKFQDGDILVAVATDKDMVAFMERSSGIITEEGGLTSHAAVVGLSINKPVIVGAANATTTLKDGDMINVDTATGAVYRTSSL
jgi:pyruvate kinase